MKPKVIDLTKFRGDNSTLYTGRPQGRDVRKELNLDEEDEHTGRVTFLIPKGTTSFNPSFYLGLLFESISKLGKESFEDKYSFDYSSVEKDYLEIIREDLKDGMRHAMNSINGDTGFSAFL